MYVHSRKFLNYSRSARMGKNPKLSDCLTIKVCGLCPFQYVIAEVQNKPVICIPL